MAISLVGIDQSLAVGHFFRRLDRVIDSHSLQQRVGRAIAQLQAFLSKMVEDQRQTVDSHRLAAHFGALTSEAESWPGAYGFRSRTGVPSKASIFSTSITLSLTEMILQRLRAIRFGRTGARQAKTPIGGLFLSPLGWI